MDSSNNLGKIVIVDDEPSVMDLLKYNLVYEGFLISAFDVAAHVSDNDVADCQLVIADAMDQQFTGMDLLRALKNRESTARVPFVMCTSEDRGSLMLDAFAIGADDFLTKPFSVRELVARVKAIMRRTPQPAPVPPRKSSILEFAALGLVIDEEQHHVMYNGEKLQLTKTEYLILVFLLTNMNKFFTRDKIYAEVWKDDDSAANIRIVDTNVSRLRKKLGDCGKNLVNRYGLGYGFFDHAV